MRFHATQVVSSPPASDPNPLSVSHLTPPRTKPSNGRPSLGFLLFPNGPSPKASNDLLAHQMANLELNSDNNSDAAKDKSTNFASPSFYKSYPAFPIPPPPPPESSDILPELLNDTDRRTREDRLAREKRALEFSEREFVRRGGMLVDENGKRDVSKTERIRAELKAEEERKRLEKEREAEERAVLDVIDRYDERWNKLLQSTEAEKTLSFEDIPWPFFGEEPLNPTRDAVNFTPADVAKFLFGSLRTRVKSEKELHREAMLRWHPDKFNSRILSRVKEEDQKLVQQASRIVMECLQVISEYHTKQNK